MSVTFVTALYDIGREKEGDGRKFTDYLEWFSKTLQLDVNLVVFVSKAQKKFVEKNRSSKNTHIICQELNEIPCYKHLTAVQRILGSGYRKWSNYLVHKLPLYSIVIYSKFGWLTQTIKLNPFKSDCFFWIDAGISRFFPKDGGKLVMDPKWMSNVQASNRVWFQGAYKLENVIKTQTRYRTQQLIEEKSGWLSCTVFGGSAKSMIDLAHDVLRVLKHDMFKRKRLHTEETAMCILYLRDPNKFQVFVKQPKNVLDKLFRLYPESGELLILLSKRLDMKQINFYPAFKNIT